MFTLPTAVAYCRVSTSLQDTQAQREACERWCANNGFALSLTCTDTEVSGSVPLLSRPSGRMLIAEAKARGCSVVVSTFLDRLFRDTLDGLQCMREAFPQAGLRVVLVNQSLDLSTAVGRLTATNMLAAAEFERELIAERTRRNAQHLQDTGRVYGHVPYGCVAIGERLYRDAARWALRVEIVGLLAEHPMRAVQAHARRAGWLAPNGGTAWSLATLSNLLRTHDRLSLLPMASEDGAGQGAAREAGVSA
jgi:DNA invertase Pin-like site-specific DNA recombinase